MTYLVALAGLGNFKMAVPPDMRSTFPPQLSESFFSLFLTCATSFPTGRFRTRSSDDRELSSRGCPLIRKKSPNETHKGKTNTNNIFDDVKRTKKAGHS